MRADDFRSRSELHDPAMDELTERIIGACIEVHRELGLGIFESMYEAAVCRELQLQGIPFQRQVAIPVMYKGVAVGEGRVDLLIAGKVIVELKACESVNAVHRAQLICYLRFLKLSVGLLINFNVAILKDGIKRVILTH